MRNSIENDEFWNEKHLTYLEIKAKLEDFCDRQSKNFVVADLDKTRLLKHITADRAVFVGEPALAVTNKEAKRWFDAQRHEIQWNHWNAYKRLLISQGRSEAIIDETEKVIDTALDFSGDPRMAGNWSRKGLVMGNVQSGKTQNYLGLINKAIDAGYRTIIVFGGHLNDLRTQTQERIDEGVLGRNSRDRHGANVKKEELTIGVGLFYEKNGKRERISITSATTTAGDFNKNFAKKYALSLEQKDPVIFTIKKNVSVLKTLISWIEASHESTSENGPRLDQPLLLIDDEADYASINTKKEKDDITATNDLIRTLLSYFNRKTYVGYTATPFANIFIDPDDDFAHEEDDLFPSDFMIKVPSPSNYMGQERFFGEETLRLENSNKSSPIKMIDDHIDHYGLKSDAEITYLPDTLEQAIRAFFIVIAIRSIRGERNAHNTMLVNISHLSAHQDSLENLIDQYKTIILHSIDEYGSLPENESLNNQVLRDFHETYTSLFDVDYPFRQVLGELAKEQRREVKVWAINQSSKKQDRRDLNYTDHADYGLNVIAIGGHKLSRGLTLEGLSISYFARNSKGYDTLMQMCRWFGYRPGYEDLCKVFIPEESIEWYGYITNAIQELYGELELMSLREQRPREFGLKVREHPGALMITAKNKIGSGTSQIRSQDLWGSVQRRYRFYGSAVVNKKNVDYATRFLTNLFESKIDSIRIDTTGSVIVEDASYDDIISFVANMDLPEDGLGNKVLIKHLKSMEGEGFSAPRVMLFNQKTSKDIWGSQLSDQDKKFLDKPYIVTDNHHVTLARRKMNYDNKIYSVPSVTLGSKYDEGLFLEPEQRKNVSSTGGRAKPIEQDFIAADERDFAGLKIYFFAVGKNPSDKNAKVSELAFGHEPTVGYSVSFPRPERLKNKSPEELKEYVKNTKHSYLVNKILEENQDLDEYSDIDDE